MRPSVPHRRYGTQALAAWVPPAGRVKFTVPQRPKAPEQSAAEVHSALHRVVVVVPEVTVRHSPVAQSLGVVHGEPKGRAPVTGGLQTKSTRFKLELPVASHTLVPVQSALCPQRRAQ